MKRFLSIFTALCTATVLCSCGEGGSDTTAFFGEDIIIGEDMSHGLTEGTIENGEHTQDAADVDGIISGYLTDSTQNGAQTGSPSSENAQYEAKESGIRLLSDRIECTDDGVTVDETSITITKEGTYCVSGTLENGRITVDTSDDAKVTLVLNGAFITCSDSAPIFVKNCDKFTLTVAENTSNKLVDGTEYSYDVTGENEPNAAVFSKDDMTINGKGSLIVSANYNNGITSKNDLVINDATLTVISAHDGIRGKDSVTVNGGTVNVQSGGDGIKSNNETESDKGYVTVNGGTLNISAAEDGIQAVNTLTIKDGSFLIKTAQGSSGAWGGVSGDSAKALKSDASIVISGGAFSIDSNDDAVHSNGDVMITGGNIKASSGDDGIHAEQRLEISGGTVTLSKSYEGLEAVDIIISGGNTHVTASDDGINGAGGNDSSSMGRPGGWGGASNATVTVTGGYLYINASGDGLDSNGSFTMTGGTVIVDGPTNNGNGPIDYSSSFTVNGGTLIAVGSSGMMQNASASSQQCCVLVYLSGNGGETFNVSSSGGENVVTYRPAKAYSCALISTSKLVRGETYTVSSGGSCTGDETDGLYKSGTYSGGSGAVTFTQSSNVTQAGTSTGGMGGGMRPGGMGGGMRPR